MASERETWMMDVEKEGRRQRINRGIVILAAMAGGFPYITTVDYIPMEWRLCVGGGFFLLAGVGAGLLSRRVGVLLAYSLGLALFPLFQYGMFCYHGDPAPYANGYDSFIFVGLACCAAAAAFVLKKLILEKKNRRLYRSDVTKFMDEHFPS